MTTEFDAENPGRALRLFGTRGSAKAYALRDFMQRSDIPFEWTELGSDDQAAEQAQVANLRDSRLPVCVSGRHADGVSHHPPGNGKAGLLPKPVPRRI